MPINYWLTVCVGANTFIISAFGLSRRGQTAGLMNDRWTVFPFRMFSRSAFFHLLALWPLLNVIRLAHITRAHVLLLLLGSLLIGDNSETFSWRRHLNAQLDKSSAASNICIHFWALSGASRLFEPTATRGKTREDGIEDSHFNWAQHSRQSLASGTNLIERSRRGKFLRFPPLHRCFGIIRSVY